jgi:hypothetical protein
MTKLPRFALSNSSKPSPGHTDFAFDGRASILHSTLTLPTLAVLAALGLPFASANGQTISLSPTVPSFDANDITQLDFSGARSGNHELNYVATDRAAQGQTFTVNELGQIESITIKGSGEISNFTQLALVLRINTVVSTVENDNTTTTLTTIRREEATFAPGFNNSNFADYLTFTLATPLEVSPGLTYGFDFGTAAGSNFYFQITEAAGTSYAGGTAYSTGDNGAGEATGTLRDADRTFLIAFTPVPEPSVALLSMISGAAVMGLRRSRRA